MAYRMIESYGRAALPADYIRECGMYCRHHTATFAGYISNKEGDVAYEYQGRFGKGFVIAGNNPKSTAYVVGEYWIEKGGEL